MPYCSRDSKRAHYFDNRPYSSLNQCQCSSVGFRVLEGLYYYIGTYGMTLGLGDITPRKENRVEKNMEHELDTG